MSNPLRCDMHDQEYEEGQTCPKCAAHPPVRSEALFAQVIPLAPLLHLLSEQRCDVNEYNICITHHGTWRAIRNEDLERMSANGGVDRAPEPKGELNERKVRQ